MKATYKFSVEAYYKIYENLVDYKNGAQLIFRRQYRNRAAPRPGSGLWLGVYSLKRQLGVGNRLVELHLVSEVSLQVDKGETPDEWINDGRMVPDQL